MRSSVESFSHLHLELKLLQILNVIIKHGASALAKLFAKEQQN
jgi:hypothetical protein